MQVYQSSYYTCNKGHQLQWAKLYINHCGVCGQVSNTMSRFKCGLCNEAYCVTCVKPPCNGEFCGEGHPMNFVPKLSFHSCDVCRKSITGGGYRCSTCDYDVCEECHIEKED